MELNEGVRERPGSEPRDVVVSVRLNQSTVEAVDRLAEKEQRKRADMLRILIQDGYRGRTKE